MSTLPDVELIRRPVPFCTFDAAQDALPGWLSKFQVQSCLFLSSFLDIRQAREAAALMFQGVFSGAAFNWFPNPTAQELASVTMFLATLTTSTGLLQPFEVDLLMQPHGETSMRLNLDPLLLTFDEAKLKYKPLADQGRVIGCIQGGFDLATLAHLTLARWAYMYCDELLVLFDSDELLRLRKGNEGVKAPKNSLPLRRSMLQPFWMISDTVPLRAVCLEDMERQHLKDWRELGITRVFTTNVDEFIEPKRERIESIGGELFVLPQPFISLHASNVWSAARSDLIRQIMQETGQLN